MDEKLTKAKYSEWLASLFGACFVAFALGVMFAGFAKPFAPWVLIIGIIMHSWGMYKTHQRNKK
ncbi:MAG: hypothetical protein A2842_00255 [Candidatus Wildermuthbacteria bacterium RIFCSPHIGHO2_01_FULL_48_25]|nr:MAG: hypothetical protein A2842_00255 [Candidatus Wildermuthbacteria bacterium RIFCSPHIGHO2_01_FULL_48_25]